MDLKLFEVRGIRLVAMLVGLLLLCANVWAMPAVGSTAVGLAQVSAQDSEEGGEVAADPALSNAVAPNAVGSDRERRLKKRLITVAVFGGMVLLLLAVVYGYFRLELTTRGFYSGRLQVLSGIASLAVVAAAYFLWRWLIR